MAEHAGLGEMWLSLDVLARWAEVVSSGAPVGESGKAASVHMGAIGVEALRVNAPPFLTGRLYYY